MDDADLTDLLAEKEEALRRKVAEQQAAAAAARQPMTHCVDCGEPLSPARLALNAERCVECQKAWEYEKAHRARLWGMQL